MGRDRAIRGSFVLGVIVVVLSVAAGGSFALMRRRVLTPDGDASLYDRAAEVAAAGDCESALPLLERARKTDPEDPDVWNLLGYCQRKAGRLDEAFESYRQALGIRPEFPAARQYLGEAHVQAALREVETLRGYGESSREELGALVTALRDAADAAGSDPERHDRLQPSW